MSGPCPRSELTSGGHAYAPDGQGGFRCSFCGIGAPFLVDGTYPAPATVNFVPNHDQRLRDAAPRLADALKQWQQWASEWGSTVTRSLPLNDAAKLGRAIRATKAALREAERDDE